MQCLHCLDVDSDSDDCPKCKLCKCCYSIHKSTHAGHFPCGSIFAHATQELPDSYPLQHPKTAHPNAETPFAGPRLQPQPATPHSNPQCSPCRLLPCAASQCMFPGSTDMHHQATYCRSKPTQQRQANLQAPTDSGKPYAPGSRLLQLTMQLHPWRTFVPLIKSPL